MKKKPFIITIDTEGDNIWNSTINDIVSTNNSKYIERFQLLCKKYGFKPTYLVNYEMLMDDYFVSLTKKWLNSDECEIGMHLHAWNTPPFYNLKERSDGIKAGLPYITDYPYCAIEEKVIHITKIIKEKYNIKPVTHRSGRWATSDEYAKILEKHGYKFDCTITPGITWHNSSGYINNSFGNDYTTSSNNITDFYNTKIIELPLYSYRNRRFKKENVKTIKSFIRNIMYSILRKERIILRPNGKNLNNLLYIVKKNKKSSHKYLMFMLHSSELMPGGSPLFDNEIKIEKLYKDLDVLFKYVSKYYYGLTIKEFGFQMCNFHCDKPKC